MTTPRACPDCGAKLPADAADELCPRCLLKVGLADSASQHTVDSASPEEPANPVENQPTEGQQATAQPEKVPYFGDYELQEEIARGGMGVVWRARQVSLNRTVAVKMIKEGQLADEREVQRFRDEAEAAASLEHPHIIPIYEVGEHNGQHYFSMKLAEGGSLGRSTNRVSARDGESQRQLVQRFIKVARAVHYAHQHGILHRDLKPDNILLDVSGEPLVTDFGLAKRVHTDRGITQTNAVVGTPAYMSPEQTQSARSLTVASDVYSLGAILYELLTGQPPFHGGTILDTLAQVRSLEPRPVQSLNPKVNRDLEIICLKCLHKEPDRRYRSAEELAEDLQRWHNGEPIVARAVSRAERVVKWVKRNPVVSGLAATVVLVLVGGLAGISWAYGIALDQREIATRRAHELKEANKQVKQENINYQIARAEAKKEAKAKSEKAKQLEQAKTRLEKQLDLTRRHLYVNQLQQVAAVMDTDPDLGYERLQDTDACPLDLRGFAWGWYANYCKREGLILKDEEDVLSMCLSSDGKMLVSQSRRGPAKIWDAASGKLKATSRNGGTRFMKLSDDGRTLISSDDYSVKVSDVTTGKVKGTLEYRNAIKYRSGVLRSDGKTAVVLFGITGPGNPRPVLSGGVKVWDVTTGQEKIILKGNAKLFTTGRLSRDGTILVARSGDKTLKVWDLPSGKERFTLEGAFQPLCLSDDSQTLCTGGGQGLIKVWDLATGKLKSSFQGPSGGVKPLCLSHDGKIFVSGNLVSMQLWDASSGQLKFRLRNGGQLVALNRDASQLFVVRYSTIVVYDLVKSQEKVTFAGHDSRHFHLSKDGKTLLHGKGVDHVIKLWDVASGKMKVLDSENGRCSVILSRDGKTLVSPRKDRIKVWDLTRGKVKTLFHHGSGNFKQRVILTGDGKRLIACSKKLIKVWDLATGQVKITIPGEIYSGNSSLSSDGTTLVSQHQGTLKVWNLITGQEKATFPGRVGAVIQVCLSARGETLVTVTKDKDLKVWDVTTGKEIATLKGRDAAIYKLNLSNDGKTLLACNLSGHVPNSDLSRYPGRDLRVWDLPTSQVKIRRQLGFDGDHPALLSPDGKTLYEGQSSINVWDVATGKKKYNLKGPAIDMNKRSPAVNLSLSDNGRLLVQIVENTITVWDVTTGKEKCTLKGQKRLQQSAVHVSNDNQSLLSQGSDRKFIKVWDLATGREKISLREGTDCACSASADGKWLCSVTHRTICTVRDAGTGQEKGSFRAISPRAMCISDDGKTIAIWPQDNQIKVWDVATSQLKGTIKADVAFLPDDVLIHVLSLWETLSLKDNGKLLHFVQIDEKTDILRPRREHIIWEVATGWVKTRVRWRVSHLLKDNGEFIDLGSKVGRALCISRDEKLLVSVVNNGNLKVWDLATKQEKVTLKGHKGHVRSAILSADARTLFSASDKEEIKVWDVPTGRLKATLKGSVDFRLCLSADGKTLSTLGKYDFKTRTRAVVRWNATTGPEKAILMRAGEVDYLDLSGDGKTLVSAAHRKKFTRMSWNVGTGQGRTTFARSNLDDDVLCRVACFSKDGRMVGFAEHGGQSVLNIRDENNQVIFTLKVPKHFPRFALNADGSTLVELGKNSLRVWDVDHQQVKGSFKRDGALTLRLSDDGKILVTGNQDNTITVRDLPERKVKWVLKGHKRFPDCLYLTPDGKTLISANSSDLIRRSGDKSASGQIKVWDLESGQARTTINGQVKNSYLATSLRSPCLALSGDGKTLVWFNANAIKVCDLTTNRERTAFKVTSVSAICLSQDGQTLFSGHSDGTIKIWDVPLNRQ